MPARKGSVVYDVLTVRVGRNALHGPKVETRLPMLEVLQGFAELGDIVKVGDSATWECPNLWAGTRDGVRITIEGVQRTAPPLDPDPSGDDDPSVVPPKPFEEPTSDPRDLNRRFRED